MPIKSHFVDVLDIHSFAKIFRCSSRHDEIYTLTVSTSLLGFFTIFLLKLLNRRVIIVDSYFKGEEDNRYTTFHDNVIDIFIKNFEPQFKKNLTINGFCSEKENGYIARYLTIKIWETISRQIELLESILVFKSHVNNGAVILQSTLCDQHIIETYIKHKLNLTFYNTVFRTKLPIRESNWIDRTQRSPSLIMSVMMFVYSFSEFIVAVLSALKVKVINKDKYHCASYDVMAIIYQPNPSQGYNDIFWADRLKGKYSRKILGVSIRPLSKSANNFYSDICDDLFYLSKAFDVFSSNNNLPRRKIALIFLKKIFKYRSYIWKTSFNSELPLFLRALLLRLHIRVITYESLLCATNTSVTWSMLEGNEVNTLSITLAAGRVNGVGLGTTWSMPYSPRIYEAISRNHVFFIWGERQKRIFEKAGMIVDSYVMVGYPTAGFYNKKAIENENNPEWLMEIKKRRDIQYVVTFYDNICFDDIIMNCDDLNSLYNILSSWVEKKSDVLLVFKSKRISELKLKSETRQRIEGLIEKDFIYVREEKADLEAGLISNVVVGISSSSLACISATYGIPCLLYDRHRVLQQDPPELNNVITFTDFERLPKLLESNLTASRDMENSGNRIDAFSDSKGEIRICDYINMEITSRAK